MQLTRIFVKSSWPKTHASTSNQSAPTVKAPIRKQTEHAPPELASGWSNVTTQTTRNPNNTTQLQEKQKYNDITARNSCPYIRHTYNTGTIHHAWYHNPKHMDLDILPILWKNNTNQHHPSWTMTFITKTNRFLKCQPRPNIITTKMYRQWK